tara:strand:+ start:252 stop:665 length:414 start_codon:yes stop_codon:yes gene_type:complete
MITFLVTNEEQTIRYECSLSESIEVLKNNIKKDFNLGEKYIDIYFDIDKPIRVLGQFNLEPGLSPRTMDRYTFDRYGIDGREINVHFEIVEGYKLPLQVKKKTNLNLSKYSNEITSGESIERPQFNLESEEDFPSLS